MSTGPLESVIGGAAPAHEAGDALVDEWIDAEEAHALPEAEFDFEVLVYWDSAVCDWWRSIYNFYTRSRRCTC